MVRQKVLNVISVHLLIFQRVVFLLQRRRCVICFRAEHISTAITIPISRLHPILYHLEELLRFPRARYRGPSPSIEGLLRLRLEP